MTRLARKNLKVFASGASNNGVFGSLQANNPTTTTDIEAIQSLPAWGSGWNSATASSEMLPPLEEMQGVQYVETYQTAYILQEGVPEWLSTCEYHEGSMVKENITGGFKIYTSLVENNINNALSDTSKWKVVMNSTDLYAMESEVVQLQNGKADKDLGNISNVTSSAKNTIIGWGIPDYSSGSTLTSPYTAPSDGFVYLSVYSQDGYWAATIGGNTVAEGGGSYNQRDATLVPVSSGDVISFSAGTVSVIFYPLKGNTNA